MEQPESHNLEEQPKNVTGGIQKPVQQPSLTSQEAMHFVQAVRLGDDSSQDPGPNLGVAEPNPLRGGPGCLPSAGMPLTGRTVAFKENPCTFSTWLRC